VRGVFLANIVKLPQLAWYETSNLEITFPDNWQVELCHMAGYNRPALSPALIREAVLHPIGTLPISQSARGKKEVVIIFDDMSRATRAAEIIPYVLEELAKAGIKDSQIRFVCALGCHGALTRHDFIKKLGKEVVTRFPIFNHNIIGNCTLVGSTSSGIKLYLNSEVMKCDYKIAIGSIVPHGFTGFGGGAKIILPGIASFESIVAMHRLKATRANNKSVDFTGIGSTSSNSLRQNIEEAAELAGLDIKIDSLLNMWGETVSIYAGSPRAAFNEALKEARKHYLTPRVKNCDIVVTNTFAKASEGAGGAITGFPSVKQQGGDIVLICNAPEGQVTHYLFGNWGNISSCEFSFLVQLPPQINRLIIFNEYKELTDAGVFTPRQKVLLLDKWDDVLLALREKYGDKAKVGVYSSAEIQYCEEGGDEKGKENMKA
jgi:lactate racemase